MRDSVVEIRSVAKIAKTGRVFLESFMNQYGKILTVRDDPTFAK